MISGEFTCVKPSSIKVYYLILVTKSNPSSSKCYCCIKTPVICCHLVGVWILPPWIVSADAAVGFSVLLFLTSSLNGD